MAFNRRREQDAAQSSQYLDDDDEMLDDEEEERPRRRRRDEDDESPRRSRRRIVAEDDDDEEEDERPRRGRRARDEDDEEEARPRRRRRSRDDEDDDDEEEERPARNRRQSSRRVVEDGWGVVDKLKSQSGFAENLKVPDDDDIVVKFLDEKPYGGYREHWVQETKEKRKTYTCLEEECPLCHEVGHRPSGRVLFNVVDLSDPQKPEVKTWSMGTKLAEKIKKLSQKQRTSPLNRTDLYWGVSKSGKGTSTEYNLVPIRADELEDWGVEPLSDMDLGDLMSQRSTKDSIRWDDLETLEQIAQEI